MNLIFVLCVVFYPIVQSVPRRIYIVSDGPRHRFRRALADRSFSFSFQNLRFPIVYGRVTSPFLRYSALTSGST